MYADVIAGAAVMVLAFVVMLRWAVGPKEPRKTYATLTCRLLRHSEAIWSCQSYGLVWVCPTCLRVKASRAVRSKVATR